MSGTVLAPRHDPDELQVLVALGGFLAGYSGNTRAAYRQDLRQFATWTDLQGLRLFEVRRAHMELFARHLEQQGRAHTTVARRSSAIASFYRYCVKEVPGNSLTWGCCSATRLTWGFTVQLLPTFWTVFEPLTDK